LNLNSAAATRPSGSRLGAKRVLCSENRAVADNGGIVGRTWFLETLLPSGRKHRAPGYERTWIVFLRTIRFRARKLPKDFRLGRTASLSLASAHFLTKSIRLYESARRMDPFREEGRREAAVNHAAKPIACTSNLICLSRLNLLQYNVIFHIHVSSSVSLARKQCSSVLWDPEPSRKRERERKRERQVANTTVVDS